MAGNLRWDSGRLARVMALLLILALAAGLRLYRLADLPPGLFWDEAGQGLDALDVLHSGPRLFFSRSLGKEPLFVYLVVPFVAWLGRHPLAVRMPAALSGVATVAATYFLVTELLRPEGVARARAGGMVAAALLAGSYWSLSLSRISFRANTLPWVMALAFAFTWRVLHRPDAEANPGRARFFTHQEIGAGFFLGLCLYTYLAGRFSYVVAATGLGILWLTQDGRRLWRRKWRSIAVVAATCLLTMAPLLIYFALHPEDFLLRAKMVNFLNPAVAGGRPGTALARAVVGNVGMFGWVGDLEPRHNLPGRSILTPWMAVLFWGAMAHTLLRRRRVEYLFAVAWFFIMLLPAILAADPPRHALRSIGAQPITYFFPAAALVWLYAAAADRWTAAGDRQRRLGLRLGATLVVVLLVCVETGLTVRDYFFRWSAEPALFTAFQVNNRALAEEINAAPANIRYIVPLNSRWRQIGGKYNYDFLVPPERPVLYHFPLAPDAESALAAFLQGAQGQEVRVIGMLEGDDVSADPQERTTSLLALAGQPLPTTTGNGYLVKRFRLLADLDRPGALDLPPISHPRSATFGPGGSRVLQLTGWGVAESLVEGPGIHLTGGGGGMLALQWDTLTPPARLLRASLRLYDGLGYQVGQADSPLVDGRPRYSQDWEAGDRGVTYHLLLADPGTPPGSYQLRLVVYDAETGERLAFWQDGMPGTELLLGAVQVGAPLPEAPVYRPPHPLAAPVEMAPGLWLVGYERLPDFGAPGLPLDARMSWQTESPDVRATLWFGVGDASIGRDDLWLPGSGVWRTTHRVLWPEGVEALGSRPLRVAVAGEGDLPGDDAWVEMGQVIGVQATPDAICPPDAGQPCGKRADRFAGGVVLQGWRAEEQPDGLAVTLYWETDQPIDQDYVVFLHLLNGQGEIIAQHDSPPANGRYPTRTWPLHTIVPDVHFLPGQRLAPGLSLRAGLYLPASYLRAPLESGGDAVEWSLAPAQSTSSSTEVHP